MSLKGILQGLGKLITKKAKPSQATGQQRKLITYTPETKKLTAKEIASLVTAAPTINITGDQNLTITTALVGATIAFEILCTMTKTN